MPSVSRYHSFHYMPFVSCCQVTEAPKKHEEWLLTQLVDNPILAHLSGWWELLRSYAGAGLVRPFGAPLDCNTHTQILLGNEIVQTSSKTCLCHVHLSQTSSSCFGPGSLVPRLPRQGLHNQVRALLRIGELTAALSRDDA